MLITTGCEEDSSRSRSAIPNVQTSSAVNRGKVKESSRDAISESCHRFEYAATNEAVEMLCVPRAVAALY